MAIEPNVVTTATLVDVFTTDDVETVDWIELLFTLLPEIGAAVGFDGGAAAGFDVVLLNKLNIPPLILRVFFRFAAMCLDLCLVICIFVMSVL